MTILDGVRLGIGVVLALIFVPLILAALGLTSLIVLGAYL